MPNQYTIKKTRHNKMDTPYLASNHKFAAEVECELVEPGGVQVDEREDLEEPLDGGQILGGHRLVELPVHNAAHLWKYDVGVIQLGFLISHLTFYKVYFRGGNCSSQRHFLSLKKYFCKIKGLFEEGISNAIWE